jgi:hypothetical protein
VIAVDMKARKLSIEGINMQTKHVKPMKGARPARAPAPPAHRCVATPNTWGGRLCQVQAWQPLAHARVAAASGGGSP